MRWVRIGYTEGRIIHKNDYTLTSRAVMYVRKPFLWFSTRKVVYIGDEYLIQRLDNTSEHYRRYKMDVRDWLLGGKINYISDNGTDKPAEIIKLVPK